MEFFLIIVSNLFTGALVYLLLSLKIERSTSSIREKKLKREMDEIMTEFNSAAETNINVLEKKISQVRNLMGRDNSIGKVDYVVSEDPIKSLSVKAGEIDSSSKRIDDIPKDYNSDKVEGRASVEGFFDKLDNLNSNEESLLSTKSNVDVMSHEQSGLIGRELKTGGLVDFKVEGDVDFKDLPVEDKIEDIFESADDKYAAINDLYDKGYSVDEISKCSGLPAGEVRLVISLNN